MAILKGSIRLMLFMIWSLLLAPVQALLLLVYKGPHAYWIPWLWQKGVCKIFGIKVRIHGAPHTKGQTVYVGNHISYLDIPVIGSTLQASFIAKSDVQNWPVFGYLSTLQQTVFIDRRARTAAKEASSIGKTLEEGKSLILFAEGTSTDGREVLPFKSSLFSLTLKHADTDRDLTIQPFRLTIDSVDQHPPDTQNLRDIYAWHRDMTTPLPAHLWRFACHSGAEISLHYLPVLAANEFTDRKTLAKACHDRVSMKPDLTHNKTVAHKAA